MIPMNPKVNIAVIIPAAGFSKRFGGSTPKQFLRLGDETVIEKSVNLFLEINKIKKIVIARSMTKFLLFGIVLFFGALLVYTFKILAISSLLYLCLIPISYFHYKKIKKEKNITSDNDEELEDIL